jgi:hypothetical protein
MAASLWFRGTIHPTDSGQSSGPHRLAGSPSGRVPEREIDRRQRPGECCDGGAGAQQLTVLP